MKAAIRYELGDIHSYEFVDGTLAWEMDESECNPTAQDVCGLISKQI